MNNVLILSRKCHLPGSAFEGPGRIPPSARPKQIFESDSQCISPHSHRISSTIYSVSLYLKDSCPKTHKNHTHTTQKHIRRQPSKTIKTHLSASGQSLEQRQDGTSDLGTGGFSNLVTINGRSQVPPAVPKYSAKTSSPAAFGPATNGICGFGKWLMVDLYHDGRWTRMVDQKMMTLKNGWQKKQTLGNWVCEEFVASFFNCQTLLITSHNNLTYIICLALYQPKLYTVSQFACLQSVQVNRLRQVKAVDVHQKKDEGNGPRRDHRGSVGKCQTLKINQAAKWKTSLSIRCMLPISFAESTQSSKSARDRKSLSTCKERKEKYSEGWSSNGMKYWKTQWDGMFLTYCN